MQLLKNKTLAGNRPRLTWYVCEAGRITVCADLCASSTVIQVRILFNSLTTVRIPQLIGAISFDIPIRTHTLSQNITTLYIPVQHTILLYTVHTVCM